MNKIPLRQISSPRPELPPAGRFKIRRVEDILAGNDLQQDLHRHDFFFILALKMGKGSHAIDFVSYNVEDHSVFFIRPGQVHQLELKAGSTGYLVEFDTAFYQAGDRRSNPWLRKAGNKNHCVLDPGRFLKLDAILHTMQEEYTDREEGYLDIIQSSLDIFFVEFVRQSPDGATKSNIPASYTQERLEEFLELLDRDMASHKQVAHYSELMHLSAYQLNGITKSTLGKTAAQLIDEQIILEAKRYLLATTNQVKEIADRLGYEDSSYFIRFFKKHTRHSPESFRRHFT